MARIGTVSRPILELTATVLAARELLDGIEPILRVPPVPDPEPTAGPEAWGTVRDGWGRPLRCLTADAPTPADREAVIAQGGKPIFISAGPDRRFGLNDVRFTADNLRSDERHTPDD